MVVTREIGKRSYNLPDQQKLAQAVFSEGKMFLLKRMRRCFPYKNTKSKKYGKMCVSGIFGQNHEITFIFALAVCEELKRTHEK